jgi:hypothetical protein
MEDFVAGRRSQQLEGYFRSEIFFRIYEPMVTKREEREF